ncbi:MAG: DEAD/DEAH box helicase [Anaerolineae bacterium]|nr:DEAD/DEAH box helicase [Anaerolineae bacterium]
MNAEQWLQQLKQRRFYDDQIVHVERLPRRRARYGRLHKPLPRPLDQALKQNGINRFYSHQAEAINAVRRGEHVVVATATASGKTLVYNVPAIESCLLDRRARALYLFPTKALAQDQLRALHDLLQGNLNGVHVGIYDGDTPQDARSEIRRRSAILLTNPDMLHVGILPNHHLWRSFFQHLRYVVIDEAHVYRGVFGSQVGCVLRRLRRICRTYGSDPQFIACSATIANPARHIETLVGVSPTVIDKDGAPQGARVFALWNPPLEDRTHGARRSANGEAADLFAALVQSGIRSLTFARSRRGAELILSYARHALERTTPELVDAVAAYRAGYTPEDRRALERALFSGELLGLTTTSALELGIDVGRLDATVLVGYPGTIASMWQQAGRAGRGQDDALTVLIGLDDPLDQYLLRHPADLFSRPHEAARCDPGNPYVLAQHLPCAAYESPLTVDDEALFGGRYVEAMVHLEERSTLDYRGRAGQPDRWFYVGKKYPAQDVGLRSASGGRVRLIDVDHGRQVLEEIDATTAHFRAHQGAIYLHQGSSYLVTDLDLRAGVALLKETEPGYYTQPRELNEINIIRSLAHRPMPACTAFYGQVRVTSQVIGYTRKKQFSDEMLSQEPLDLPPQTFETAAVWWDVPVDLGHRLARQGGDLAGALHAVEHGCIAMLPLLAMCDRFDLGGVSTVRHVDTETPLVCVYDAYPGGVGLAERGFEVLEAWWQATVEAIANCPCEAGCPSCIHSPKCGNNNEPLDKAAAVTFLRALLE